MSRLSDVARLAGVSTSTASRALARPEMVAEATRTRILDAADELGFRYNRAARALTTGRTGMVGLVVPTLANPYYPPLVLGAQHAAEDTDCHLLMAVSEHSAQREERLIDRLSRQVDGLVLAAPLSTDRALRRLAETHPLVLLDRKVARLPAVVVDTATGVDTLARHLLALGHSRISYVCGPPDTWADARRREAVGKRVGRNSKARLHVLGPFPPSFEAGIGAAATLPEGDTAVVAYNSSLALGMLHALSARQVRVPSGLSLAAADDLAPLSATTPTVTALRLPVRQAGHDAIIRLRELLDGTRSSRARILPSKLVVRESTSAPAEQPPAEDPRERSTP